MASSILKQMGVEGIFLTSAFNQGLSEYTRGFAKAEDVTKSAATSINAVGSNLAGPVGGALSLVTGGLGTLATVGVGAVGAVTAAVGGLIAATGALALNTAKVENIEIAFSNMANAVGLSLDQLRQAVKGSVTDDELMTLANEALVGSGEELGKEFGAHLPELFAIARASAKATGKDFKTVLEGIDQSIKYGMTRGLRSAGITVDQDQALQAYALTVGKTVDALTDEDKSLAILNATLTAGAPIVAIWANAADTASGSMKKAKTSFDNTADALGTFFLPALKTVWDAIGRVATALEGAVKEGGALYPLLVRLGAVMSLMADGFSAGVDAVMGFVDGLTGDVSTSFTDFINEAFQWGTDFILQFAQGLIDGATGALNGAANFVNSLLGFWFAPGSPPKVAPEIDTWGANTMNTYLGGFTEADFGILKDLQAPLREAMGLLAEKGANIGPAWANVSRSIVQALAGGDITQAFSSISAATGEYANDLIKLAQAEWSVKKSTDAVTLAEDRLKTAQKNQADNNLKVNKGLREYNQMLRSGASKDALRNKLAEINAAEKAVSASDKEVDAAQTALDSAKQQNDLMKEQLALQKQIIDQIFSMAKAQQEVAEKAAGGGKGGGGGVKAPAAPPTGREMTSYGGTPQDIINQQIEAAKQALATKLGEMWESVKTGIAEQLGPSLQGFQDAWNNAYNAVSPVWENIKAKVGEVTGWVSQQVGEGTAKWNSWWEEHGASVEIVWGKIKTGIGDATKWISDTLVTPWLEAFKTNWQSSWDNIQAGLTASWDLIKKLLGEWLDGLGSVFDGWATIFTTDWGQMFTDLGTNLVTSLQNSLASAWEGFLKFVQGLVDKLPEVVKKALGIASPSKVMIALGKQIPAGLTEGVKSGIQPVEQSAMRMAQAIYRPMMAASPISTSTTTNTNFYMGGMNVNNAMNARTVTALIRKTLAAGLR